MGSHIINGKFQSDKYPTTPPGKVPLSVRDPAAQDLLWEYAERHRIKDAEFSDDLQQALQLAGYRHGPEWCENCVFAKHIHYDDINGKLVAPGCTGYEPAKSKK